MRDLQRGGRWPVKRRFDGERMIEARGLTKRYGTFVAVDAIDLSITGPGVVGFLGPNGAGKTTTMRMLTGYLPMTEGSAVIAGHDVFDDPISVKANVGYLPESPPLYAELTVGEFLTFAAEIHGLGRDRLARVGAAMERVGLRGFERRLLGSLSKGYRQRVGLAQAIVHDPPLIILDEPTSGLDPAQLVGIRALIRELGHDRTVVLSTHILQEVDALCERVIVIHRGKIAGSGTVDELAAAAGSRPWLEVRLGGDAAAFDGATARLGALPEVSEIESLPASLGEARFRVRGGDAAAAAVARLAASTGWELRALAPHRASLEDVFLGLVGVEG
jgi:ABC-2 type transport system ATP-binding protein